MFSDLKDQEPQHIHTYFSLFPFAAQTKKKKKQRKEKSGCLWCSFSLEKWTTAIIHTTIPYL